MYLACIIVDIKRVIGTLIYLTGILKIKIVSEVTAKEK